MFQKILSIAVFTCLLSLSVFAKDIQKADLRANIECNNSKNKIEKMLKKTNGVQKVNINMKDQSVKVEYDKNVVSEAQLVEVLNKADNKFRAKSAHSGADAKGCGKSCSHKEAKSSCSHKEAKSCTHKEGKKCNK